jgi:hypothetical protein
MFNIHTTKHGKTYKRELENIKQKIVKARDRGVCDSEGRTIEKKDPRTGRGLGPVSSPGKGDRNRIKKVLDYEDLCRRAAKNLWPRDENGNLIED